MKILVTGLCTLHWGRLQYGNIGNYYIIEPMFRELHRVFEDAEIITTFQMTDAFVEKERIRVVPMEMYYAWRENEVKLAQEELEIALSGGDTKNSTPYIKLVRECQLVINVSGDMWGDNAEHVGKDRFLVDLLKMRTAQRLGAKTVLFAVTPGPFTDEDTLKLAKEVYQKFDLVINREAISTRNMEKWGFTSKHVEDFACPAFLFEPELSEADNRKMNDIVKKIGTDKMVVGFTIGGFNMPVGPYDMWPREEWQYDVFAQVIEHIINDLEAKVVLISHTNGFELPPHFRLINGRDYPILEQLQEVIIKRKKLKNPGDLICLEGPYLPNLTKAIIGKFDMMITGRVHASVAAISQYVPTVFLRYEKNFISSTKMYGFSSLAGVEEFVCEPGNREQILQKVDECYENLDKIKSRLQDMIPLVKEKAKTSFDRIKNIAEE